MKYPDSWSKKQVCVAPEAAYVRSRPVFDVLEEVFPVKFSSCEQKTHDWEGAVIIGAKAQSPNLLRARFPVLLLRAEEEADFIECNETRFVSAPPGQPYLNGCSLQWKKNVLLSKVAPESGDNVIATSAGRPTWIQRRNTLGSLVFKSGVLPPYDGTRPFITSLLAGAYPVLLPLLDFLRYVTVSVDYESPPVKACFIFDDPNLHWTSWGFLDYRRLIEQAQKHDYHAVIATVPIDTWYTNPAAASLFREHSDRISLMVHGVKHTHAELLVKRAERALQRDLAKGLELIRNLESRASLPISHVMAPPHHACSAPACDLMLQTGYEAACVSWTQLLKWNHDTNWPRDFGLNPTEFLGHGFPVIPRFNFTDKDDSRIFLAALLRQPIVFIGHHGDLSMGYELLRERADKVRQLGKIEWCGISKIARGCYLTKRTRNSFWIRMQTRQIDVTIPEGVDQLHIERPWISDELSNPLVLQHLNSTPTTLDGGRIIGPMPTAPGNLWISSPQSGRNLSSYPEGRTAGPVFALGRRFLCEGRDRFAPLLVRFGVIQS